MGSTLATTRPVVVARVHEVALKGRNRPWFMRVLIKNIAFALRDSGVTGFKARSGRVLMSLDDIANWPSVRDSLRSVFGVANFSLTLESGLSMESIQATVAALIEVNGPPTGSFCVRAKRSDKQYPMTSPEIERVVGAFVRLGPADLL